MLWVFAVGSMVAFPTASQERFAQLIFLINARVTIAG
jgi:hypothetical protein